MNIKGIIVLQDRAYRLHEARENHPIRQAGEVIGGET